MHNTLSPSEIHVWHTDLSDPRHRYEELAKTLSIDERTRAGRFTFEDDQRRFVIARGVLRKLLAGYTDRPAEALQFEHNRYGKPILSKDSVNHLAAQLHFNVSHSHDVAVYVLAYSEVGIDVERIRPFDDALEIARSFFQPHESITLEGLPTAQQIPSFFQSWARKEAYIKALGRGLSDGLDTIDVGMGVSGMGWMPAGPDLQLHDVTIDDTCACAVAASTQIDTMMQFAYPA